MDPREKIKVEERRVPRNVGWQIKGVINEKMCFSCGT
jgi:hypothetical protein